MAATTSTTRREESGKSMQEEKQKMEDKTSYFKNHQDLIDLSPDEEDDGDTTVDETDDGDTTVDETGSEVRNADAAKRVKSTKRKVDEGLERIEKAWRDTSPSNLIRNDKRKRMESIGGDEQVPRLVRQKSSFLGPTPKERRAEFERFAMERKMAMRKESEDAGMPKERRAEIERFAMERKMAMRKESEDAGPEGSRPSSSDGFSTPPPPPEPPKQTARARARQPDDKQSRQAKGKKKVEQTEEEEIPFWRRVGSIPRELKSGRNVKPATRIVLVPERRQLFKGKIVYYYPNDDVSTARRQRIHKLIQLGAAWVTKWRDDVTHVVVDDKDRGYGALMRHLGMKELPRTVVLVKFDPYIPQCMQLGTVLDPTANHFLVKDAPKPQQKSLEATVPSTVPESQSDESLKVKLTRKQQREKEISQKTDSVATEDSNMLLFPPPSTDRVLESPAREEIVKDSFVQPPSDSVEEPIEALLSETRVDYGDALSKAIEETKAIAHLPLDEDEDEGNDTARPGSANSDSETDTDVESPRAVKKQPRKSKFASAAPKSQWPTKKGFDQANYQCMDPRKTNANANANPNARTIQILEEMGRYYDQMQDSWRTLAYRRAVSTLRKQTTKITTREEASALPFIGSRLAEKIEEIVLTNRLRRLDSTKSDPADQTLRMFLNIYGVGLSQAHKWLQAGHRTLDDLLKHAKLTTNQKIGIDHYTDFTTRIPRDEVAAHASFVRKALHAINPDFQVHTMGSYRRGAITSGDIDLLITAPGVPLSTLQTTVFDVLVPRLFALDFLKVSLASSHGTNHRTADGTKWHGASLLPGTDTWRRIDLLLVPSTELGAAFIYFTGNDIFNRSMRLLASKKGMRLNQRGLFKDVMRGPKRERITEGELVEGESERRIFEVLGVPWREAEERIC
ncbi:hypothetical protein BU24DRAFT_447269 [Aaosphaeria arxii CBS 175.79]|uniref:DNA-directed DNA polymerase n=1 Tax=Aaosphaeria arxii CBS 175.79 TaxID=1450172 RepID=A0A6A5XZ82_9PLEO|nr:uncharacterized protein BU24DRAFT_447269 [Aaosphaeria arxii CBS 175.79]KAF2018608.1 hypothetical protein BU24DRAFT_447269 [Aaosphaeria arxii CBS 175.79]